jgi:hypothetical protein
MNIKFWLDNIKERDEVDDLGVNWKIMLEWILGEMGGKVWTGCICHRIRTSGGLL